MWGGLLSAGKVSGMALVHELKCSCWITTLLPEFDVPAEPENGKMDLLD